MTEACGIVLIGASMWILARRISGERLRHIRLFLFGFVSGALVRPNPDRVAKNARLLEQAGRSRNEVESWLRVRRIVCFGALAGAPLLLLLGFPWIPCLAAGGSTALLPSLWLKRRIGKRRREILLTLPFYLDLLNLTLEAGLDLIAALEEIVTGDAPNALRDEIAIVLKSIRLGRSRSGAFEDLAERTGVDALRTLAGCIRQSEELGAGLGPLLRLQAGDLRREIYLKAEERAQKAQVRMLFPLILCIFPVLFLLLFVPIALRLIR
jgi:tight adherence protein C